MVQVAPTPYPRPMSQVQIDTISLYQRPLHRWVEKRKMKQGKNKRASGRDGQAEGQDICVGGLPNMGQVADKLSAE